MTPHNNFTTQNPLFILILSVFLTISVNFTYTMGDEPPKSFFNQCLAFMPHGIQTKIQSFSNILEKKVPTKMQTSFYWNNSFINGFKTNTAFALLATFAYPLNIVSGKNALLLQTLFLIKNIICIRIFLNNKESTYFKTTDKSFNLKQALDDNGTYLNNFIGPYSLILLGFGLSYGGFKQIKSFANKTNILSFVFNDLMQKSIL